MTESLAIVLLNYNGAKHLETYLPSVVEHSAGVRIIVVDNGSTDESQQVVALFPQVEWMSLGGNHGFAQGYNLALAKIQADYFLLLNSDVAVTANWLEPMLEWMRLHPRCAVVQPKVKAWLRPQTFEYAGAAGGWLDALGYPFCRGRLLEVCETDTGQYQQTQQCFWASGAAFLIRSEAWKAAGGFEASYWAHMEEIELCWRLQRMGYEIWCVPASEVFHLGGGSLGYGSPHKTYLNFRNSLWTILRHELPAWVAIVFVARLFLDGAAGLLFLFKGQAAHTWAIVRAHWAVFGSVNHWLKARKYWSRYPYLSPGHAGRWPHSLVIGYYLLGRRKFKDLKGLGAQ